MNADAFKQQLMGVAAPVGADALPEAVAALSLRNAANLLRMLLIRCIPRTIRYLRTMLRTVLRTVRIGPFWRSLTGPQP